MKTADLTDIQTLATKLVSTCEVEETVAFVIAGTKLTGGCVAKALIGARSRNEITSSQVFRIRAALRDA